MQSEPALYVAQHNAPYDQDMHRYDLPRYPTQPSEMDAYHEQNRLSLTGHHQHMQSNEIQVLLPATLNGSDGSVAYQPMLNAHPSVDRI